MKNNDLIETRNDIVFSQIEDIKKDIISTRNKILTDANKELINMYFRIGKIISENQKYGSNFVNSFKNRISKYYWFFT